ncbi:helix-turn-helix domain-containing protein [Variovorax paradoxus]|uniref:helix-turn-helix domain-containing protein n=1 Tax=Variovorax paradoxus TaxID=34073 RepID=UPI001AE4104D|nr:helix-turn-helix transcriptional regulator [Variovorax paradoxus]
MPSPSPKYALDPALLSLGQAVRNARKARGISQEQLALASQVERSYMSSIERGMQNVGVMTLVRISATLGLTVADLMAQAHL